MHLVEALVYGLAGGKKTKPSQSEYSSEYSSSARLEDFPTPPPSVPIRGTGLPNREEVVQALPPGMAMSGKDLELSRFKPVFDPGEMLKLNQAAIVNLARRKAGIT